MIMEDGQSMAFQRISFDQRNVAVTGVMSAIIRVFDSVKK